MSNLAKVRLAPGTEASNLRSTNIKNLSLAVSLVRTKSGSASLTSA